MSNQDNGPTTQRLDKWLWHARVVKTRTLATKLVSAGHVRLDGSKVSQPAYKVKIGHVLTISLPSKIRILEITGFAQRRGSATMAAQLFNDLTPVRDKSLDQKLERVGGRPTKKARRELDRYRNR